MDDMNMISCIGVKFRYSFYLVLFSVCAMSQVTNIDYEYDEVSEQMEITYDLEATGDEIYYDVSVSISIEGSEILANSISGDIGKFIKAGVKKTIYWDMFKDVTSIDGDLSVQVDAYLSNTGGEIAAETSSSQEAIPANNIINIPRWLGPGVSITIGSVLTISGIIDYSGARTDWDNELIKTEQNTVFGELNKKYKRGQYLMVGGAAVLVASVYKLMKNRTGDEDFSLGREPGLIDRVALVGTDLGGQGIGLGLVVRIN